MRLARRSPGIHERLLLLLIVPFAMLILILATFAWTTSQTHSSLVSARRSSGALTAYRYLLTTLLDAETGMRGYVVTGSGTYREPLDDAGRQFAARLSAVLHLPAQTPALDAMRSRMLALAVRAYTIDAHLALLAEQGRRSAAMRGIGSGKRAMDAFRAADAALEEETATMRARASNDLNDALSRTFELLAFSVLVGLGTMAVLYITITRGLIARLKEIGQTAIAIASGGVPGRPARGKDEISLLDRTLRSMLEDLKTRDAMLARYKLFAIHGRDIIVFVNSKSFIVEANAAAVDAYGYTREEMLELPLSTLHEGTRSSVETTLELVRAQGVTYVEAMQVRKNGETFPVELSYDSADVEGEILVLVVARDVSERRRSEAALAVAYEGAVESSRLKSQFVATMSHEIRTPMNAVIGMNELLLETPLTAEQRDYAQTVRDSSTSLLRVIDDVLDFSKIEAGRLHIDSIDFELAETVESSTALFAATAVTRGVSLMVYVETSMRQIVSGDQNRLRQVLINLIGNAVKFTEHGSIEVSAHALSETATSSIVRFSIKDSGIGFDATTARAIFEPFRQADGTTTRKYGGTGLGLSISKDLVELMGGTLTVSSVPDQGSVFSFTVKFGRAKTDRSEPPKSLRGARALIVDDNQSAREIFLSYLGGWEIEVATAPSAASGLGMLRAAAAARKPYDLVIVDYAMPDATGFDFREAALADSRITAPPMIMVTAYDKEKRGERAIAAGFACYLTKPIRRAHLHECIVTALEPVAPCVECEPAVGTAAQKTALRAERILIAEDNPVNQRLALQQLKNLGFEAHVVGDGNEALEALSNESFESRVDGLPDAVARRVGDDAADTPKRGEHGAPLADRRDDGERAPRRSRRMPRLRHGRLFGQAGPARRHPTHLRTVDARSDAGARLKAITAGACSDRKRDAKPRLRA